MAKRVLKDWTASDKVDTLSAHAEVFFTRLIMKADDFGSYYANPKLLKAALFPLKEEVTYKKIGVWVFECIEAGLIFPYEADGREYIRIVEFGQRLQNMRNAHPHPPKATSPEITVDNGKSPSEEKRNETEREPAAASLSVNGSSKVPHGPIYDPENFYTNGQQAFEHVQQDEIAVENLLRVVRRSGYPGCDEITLMKAVRHFYTAEEAKPDFTNRPRDELKKHLVNWIRTKAKNLTQYG